MMKHPAAASRKRSAPAPAPAMATPRWTLLGGSRAGLALLLLCLLLPATVLLAAAASSSNGSGRGAASAAAATGDRGGGAYPLMAPLVASWFKKGAANSNNGKAPVAASAAARLLVRADGEVDLELAVDGPGSEAEKAAMGSSLLQLVAGRGKGKGERKTSLATTPSPAEAAKAARRLFLSLVTGAVAPVAAVASGALRRLAELLQQIAAALSEAAQGAAAAGGDVAKRAARGPGALLAAVGRTVEAVLAEAAEESVASKQYTFPRDTAAFLGDTGKRVGASVLRAAAHTAGHVGRAGQHVKHHTLNSPPVQHAGKLARGVAQGVKGAAAAVKSKATRNNMAAEEIAAAKLAPEPSPRGWFQPRSSTASSAPAAPRAAPAKATAGKQGGVPFLKGGAKPVPQATPKQLKQQKPAATTQATPAAEEAAEGVAGAWGVAGWALLLVALGSGGAAAAAAMGGHGAAVGALATKVGPLAAKAGPAVHLAAGATLRFLERKGAMAAAARVNAYLEGKGVHAKVGRGWGHAKDGWARVLVAMVPAREAAERGCLHLGAGKDNAHALLLRLHWQLQQACAPLLDAARPALAAGKAKAAAFGAEAGAALLTWLSETHALLTDKATWAAVYAKAQSWWAAVAAAASALLAAVAALWAKAKARVAAYLEARKQRRKQEQQAQQQQAQQQQAQQQQKAIPASEVATAPAAASVSPVAAAVSEEGRDRKAATPEAPQRQILAGVPTPTVEALLAAKAEKDVKGDEAAEPMVGSSAPIPGAAAASTLGYLATTASSFFFLDKQSAAAAPTSKEEAKGQEGPIKEGGDEEEEEGEEKQHPLAGSAHSSGSGASSDGFEVVGQRPFTPSSLGSEAPTTAATAAAATAAAAGVRAASSASSLLLEDGSDEEGEAALAAAVGHALALQKAEAEAAEEGSDVAPQEQEAPVAAAAAGGVTGAINRMMLNWGLTGAESFVVVDRAASPAAAAAEATEKKPE